MYFLKLIIWTNKDLMIIVKLIWWLGNQLFQYALWKNLAIKNNCELFLDLWMYKKDFRKFELWNFNIDAKIAWSREKPFYQKIFHKKYLNKLWYFITFIWKKLNPKHHIENPKHPIIHRWMYDFQARILNLKWNYIYLEGFWQSEKYFIDIKDEIIKNFTLKNKDIWAKNLELLDTIKAVDSVSLHVRRGDYLTCWFAWICEKEYYTRAMEIIKLKLNNPRYFIFSEDMQWCKDNLEVSDNDIFVDWNKWDNSYLDMIMMSKCKHNIIANSTFSWWWAYLNSNPKKLIIAPKKWHNNLDYKDIIPENWIRI